ncbi:MAG: hypothetical protein ACE15C_14495 [Phycisphaerae bacterium]
MYVTLDIPAQTRATIDRHAAIAAKVDAAMAAGLLAGAVAGGEFIAGGLVTHGWGAGGRTIRAMGGTGGLADAVRGWPSPIPMVAYIGVPSSTPASAYARQLNDGGPIYPRNARALAVPVSAEARRHTSPRDMADLVMLKRKGKPPLLVREISRGRGKGRHLSAIEVHYVLLSAVYTPAFRWFDDATDHAGPTVAAAFSDEARKKLGLAAGGGTK